MTPRVHQRRIPLRQGLSVEPQSPQCAGPEVRQEDVGGLEELVQNLTSLLPLEVERERALPAIGERDRQVDSAAVGPDPLCHQAPVRVTLGAFDAHDIRTPVGEQGTGDGHEDPLRELDDPYTFERTIVHVDHVNRRGFRRGVRG